MSSAVWLTAMTGVLILLAHVLNNDLSMRRATISELSLGRFGWVMDIAYGCWMLAHIVVAHSLWPFVPVSQALLLGGIGILQGSAGYFRTDSTLTPPRNPSRARKLHYASSIGFIIGFPIVVLMLGISLYAGGYPFARRALILAVPVWGSFLLFMAILLASRRRGFDQARSWPLGLSNRLVVVCYLGWLFGMALKV